MKKVLLSLIVLFGLYLGLHNGYIALFDTSKASPIEVFPYRADLYPHLDQKELINGIPVSDSRKLASLLEDYLS